MTSRNFYLNRAKHCSAAAETISDQAERLALSKIAQSYMLLADYVAARQEHGTAHRSPDTPELPADS
jgi:hypothetical protein